MKRKTRTHDAFTLPTTSEPETEPNKKSKTVEQDTAEECGTGTFDSLPPETQLHVFAFLDARESLHAMLTCTDWHRLIACDPALWKIYYMKAMGADHDPLFETLASALPASVDPFWRWLLRARKVPITSDANPPLFVSSSSTNYHLWRQCAGMRARPLSLADAAAHWACTNCVRRWRKARTSDATRQLERGVGFRHDPDGHRIYAGQWENGKAHGFGIETAYAAAGRVETYVGEFAHGKRWGHGVCVFSNGTRFEGGWFQGRMHGSGSVVFPNGDRQEGVWREDDARERLNNFYVRAKLRCIITEMEICFAAIENSWGLY